MVYKIKELTGLLGLALIMFIVTLDTTITNIALPTITANFKTSLDTSNWVSTIYVLVLSVCMIPVAKIGDQLGRKKTMLLGLIFFGSGSLFCGFSNSINWLITMRGVQGVGGAIATTIMIPLCVSLLGREKANQAVGEIGAVAALAAAIGPTLGGLIIHYWSWHFIFFINVPITLVALVLIYTCFSESYDLTISSKINYLGILLLSLTLFLLTFVLLKGYDFGWTSQRIIFISVAAMIFLITFVVNDLKQKEPLIEFSLFKNSTFLSSTIIYFTAGFTIVCSSVIFNFFLEDVLNYSALRAGLIIMFSSVMVIIAMPLGNKLGQQFSFRWPIMAGSILMAVSLLLLTQISYIISKFDMIFDMCVLGLGFGLASLSLVSAVQYIPETKAGIASGMVNAARQLGTCLGIALLVGTLNNNVKVASQAVQADGLSRIQSSRLAPDVKKVLKQEVSRQFKNTNNVKLTHKKINMKIIKQKSKKTVQLPEPSKSSDFDVLYPGSTKLTQGSKKLDQSSQEFYQYLYSENKTSGGRLDIPAAVAEKIAKNNYLMAIEQSKLRSGIQLVAQKQVLQRVLKNIKQNKNQQLTQAFTKTFWIAFIFLALTVPIAYWSDKSIKLIDRKKVS
ncbi:MFS transporter [Oenococcus sicerae]|uniref:MFS transporter n=1 Tax=Oenococcus sicerae TaxID=2203724 RepID=A0ABX5QLV0_9LACO|nr:MFS transporter [Oenococcus sicerae]QAS69682.1 MFS transporter [Oenococcus sicerae]